MERRARQVADTDARSYGVRERGEPDPLFWQAFFHMFMFDYRTRRNQMSDAENGPDEHKGKTREVIEKGQHVRPERPRPPKPPRSGLMPAKDSDSDE
jgi:hypothetical protein